MTRIEQIRARLKAATPGPWQTRFMFRMFQVFRGTPGCCTNTHADKDWADADLCAHAPDDIEALLRVVEAARDYKVEWDAWCDDGALTPSNSHQVFLDALREFEKGGEE